MTVPADKARAVRALHATGRWSHRRLTAKFNLSRVTVWRILTGQACHAAGAADAVAPDEDPTFVGKAVRCPVCGFTTVPPCQVCAAIEAAPEESLPADDDPLRLDLHPADHARYCELLARKGRIDPVAGDEFFTMLAADGSGPLEERAADEYFAELGERRAADAAKRPCGELGL